MPRLRPLLLLATFTLAACPEPESEPRPLVDMQAWVRVVDATADVFAEQRPTEAVCDDAGWSIDPFVGLVEIDTALCDYPTLEQTTLEPVQAGDTITIDAYHDVLSAPEPATGYIGLALDGVVVWEWQTAIPSDATEIRESFTAAQSFPAGAQIQVHVHNHGPNTWELRGIEVTHE